MLVYIPLCISTCLCNLTRDHVDIQYCMASSLYFGWMRNKLVCDHYFWLGVCGVYVNSSSVDGGTLIKTNAAKG